MSTCNRFRQSNQNECSKKKIFANGIPPSGSWTNTFARRLNWYGCLWLCLRFSFSFNCPSHFLHTNRSPKKCSFIPIEAYLSYQNAGWSGCTKQTEHQKPQMKQWKCVTKHRLDEADEREWQRINWTLKRSPAEQVEENGADRKYYSLQMKRINCTYVLYGWCYGMANASSVFAIVPCGPMPCLSQLSKLLPHFHICRRSPVLFYVRVTISFMSGWNKLT